jgi:RNA polymerase sigma factor (sigma-70 family)
LSERGPGRFATSESRQRLLERLIDEHARLLSAVVRRVCGSRFPDLVPDVEQEVKLALWKRARSGEEIRHPVSYIYKVALTTSLALIRRYRPEREQLTPEPVDPPEPRLALGGLFPAERQRLVAELIETLDEDEARALRGYLTGLNHQELAELYGWSPSVARHRVYRTLERLRRRVGEGADD